MLQPLKSQLNSMRIVLASGSPRRQELMKNIGLNAELCPSLFEENLNPKDFSSYAEFVEETALQKVLEVSERLSGDSTKDSRDLDIILGADTIVTLDGKVYGKPKTHKNAFEMLSELIGKPHVVYTGVVIKKHDQIVKFTETAKVFFGRATPEQIQAYVDTDEPLDKAGGYGIQGIGGTMIEKIEGDYFTVMGLPLYRLSVEICKLLNYKID